MAVKSNLQEFITKANIKHNSKYDYSISEYIKNNTNLIILCPIHGEFKQTPYSHLNSLGCSKCSKNHKYTNVEFTDKLKSIFSDKYNYDKVVYINNSTKVIISCDIHGDFEKLPLSLSRGSGCNKCESKNYKIDTNIFIERAISVHGTLYDYSKVQYVNDLTPVAIICKKHGEFNQPPAIHLSNHGCIKCSGRYKYDNSEFIAKAIAVHGDVYDYSRVNYINAHTKITIICSLHGEFNQIPNSHLSGKGCKFCTESRGEKAILEFLTLNKIKYIREKTFSGCFSKKKLHFDFYLPEYNSCIEFDGEQHFKSVDFFGGEDGYNKRKLNDNIKNEYCFSNNIHLVRIPYDKIDDVEYIISGIIQA